MVAGGIGQTPFLALARAKLGLRATATRRDNCPARQSDPLLRLPQQRIPGRNGRFSPRRGRSAAKYEMTALPASRAGDRLDPPGGQAVDAALPHRVLRSGGDVGGRRCRERLADVPCQVSLETPMACGIGICFSCVAKVRDGAGHWDYRRTCLEGPVFEAGDIEFDG